MLSNVDIVRELGENIVVLPLKENTIGSSYVNLTASRIAWSRANSKLLKIASIGADGVLQITRVDDLETEENEIKNLEKEIEDLKNYKPQETNNTLGESSDLVDSINKIKSEYDVIIGEKEKELHEKKYELSERRLNIEKANNELSEELRAQLRNELKEKKELSFLIIPPHDTGLILTNETVAITEKYGGLFHAIVKDVSYGRGHIATTLNPGWYGKPLVAVHNHTDKHLIVQEDSRFVKLSFRGLDSKATLRPNDLGSRSDIVDHLKLYRPKEYNDISKFFIGYDLKELLKTFSSILKGKNGELDDNVKNILLNGISDEIVKKNYEKSKEKSMNRIQLFIKYYFWDIITAVVLIVSLGFLLYYIFTSDISSQEKDYLIPITSSTFSGALARFITKYIEKKSEEK